MAPRVPRDPSITPEMRRFLEELATPGSNNIFDSKTATEATALLNVFTALVKGLAPASGGGTTNFLRADATWASPIDTTGAVIQCLQTTYDTNTSLATALPLDDTIPGIGEGSEILSLQITPTDNTNKILCQVKLWGNTTVSKVMAGALFRGSTCINAHAWAATVAGLPEAGGMDYLDSPASTSAQTYSVRVGTTDGTAMFMNGTNLTRWFGGASVCTLTLMEVAA